MEDRAKYYGYCNEKLYHELDIMEIIKVGRITKFLNKIYLRKYQKDLIQYFSEYEAELPRVEEK